MDKKRIPFIDEIRGFAILMMVIFHTFYDLKYVFSIDIKWFNLESTKLWVLIFACIFIFVSGISSRFSRNNLKRGAICLFLGYGITVVTSLIEPDQTIVFGILSMLGCCMLIYGLLENWLEKIPAILGLILMPFLFIVTFTFSSGVIGFQNIFTYNLPEQIFNTAFLFPLGITSNGFSSADYYPIIPFIFMFLSGSYLGHFIKQNKMPKFFYNTHFKWLATIGKYTLWIYLLHQPVVYLILKLILRAK